MISKKFYEIMAAVNEAADGLEVLNSEGFEYEHFVNTLHDIWEALESEIPIVGGQYA